MPMATSASDTMPEIASELGAEITPKSDGNCQCDLAAAHEGLLILAIVFDLEKLRNDGDEESEETDDRDKDVHPSHCCGHDYECHKMISCRWNEIMCRQKTPSSSKPYDLEGEIMPEHTSGMPHRPRCQ